ADDALKAYRENMRKLTDLARADLLLKMTDVLSDQEFKSFKEALERPPAGAARRAVTVDDIVERIMSFDKNKDGKITKDELPERMQGLIEKGDTNKDGALDKDEIKKLATDLARDGGFPGFGAGGPPFGRPQPGTILPPLLRTQLKLTAEQEKQVADLEKETRTKLMKILTEEQKKQLEEARPHGPGGRPPGVPARDRPPQ